MFSTSRNHKVALWLVGAGVCITTLVIVSASGCGSAEGMNPDWAAEAAKGEETPRVRTVTVDRRDLRREIEMPGTVEGFETAELYAKVGGYLREITVDIGDRVEASQVLAKLWNPEIEKELEEKQAAVASAVANARQAEAMIRQSEAEQRSAQARLEEARMKIQEKQALLEKQLSEYERTQNLVQSGSLQEKLLDEAKFQRDAAQAALGTVQARIRTAEAELAAAAADVDRAETDHQSALAKVDLAQAELERTRTMLQYGEIRAPFDGVVTKRFVDRGAFIQPADGNSAAKPLLTVTRIDVVRIFLDIPMAEVRWLDRGDKAVLDRINVLPGESFEGEVSRFSPSINRDSRMMRVEVDLQNPEHRLLPGFYGYVTLLLDEFEQSPIIPSSALMVEGNESFVYCVENGICRRHLVTMNYQDGTIIGISSGLSGGEQVVQAGAGQFSDQQRVIAVGSETEG